MTKQIRRHFVRHHDDEMVDGIQIDTVSRWKTSGMSGDEWRVSYRVRIYRKGTLLYERGYSRLRFLVAHLPWALLTMSEGGDASFDEAAWSQRIKDDAKTCHQVGCAQPATVFYRLKDRFAPDGNGPLPRTEGFEECVAFCVKHQHRGDCGREDSDDNYEEVEVQP